jgi:hypothetical protein
MGGRAAVDGRDCCGLVVQVVERVVTALWVTVGDCG